MASGYTRQSDPEISPGQEITAAPIDLEFNTLAIAFDNTDGHDHSGAISGSGAPISLTGAVAGILPVNHGGTGRNSLTDRRVLIGRGALPVEFAAPGTIGGVLASTGTITNPAFTLNPAVTSLTTTGLVSVGTTLGVAGGTTLFGALGVYGPTTIDDNFLATGNGQFNGALYVGGTTTLGAININGALNVTNNAVISGTLNVGGTINTPSAIACSELYASGNAEGGSVSTAGSFAPGGYWTKTAGVYRLLAYYNTSDGSNVIATAAGSSSIRLFSGSNYYDNNVHVFRPAAGSANWLVINGAGLATIGGLSIGGGLTVGGATSTANLTVNGTAYITGAFTTDGYATINDHCLITGNLQVNANLQTTTLTTSGVATIAGNITTPGSVNAAFINSSGGIATTGISCSSLTASGTISGNVITASSVNATTITAGSGGLRSTNVVSTTDVLGGQTYALFTSGTTSYLQYLAEVGNANRWEWDGTNGDLQYRSLNVVQWVMRRSLDSMCFNAIGPVGGFGAYYNSSDRRGKEDITKDTCGLVAVLQLNPVSFKRVGQKEREVGFVAQELQESIPLAVREVAIPLPDGTGGPEDEEPTLGITTTPIVAALVNAVKELSERIQTLERHQGVVN